VLSLGSAIIGAATALTATGLQLRNSRRQDELREAAGWRERGARVLGLALGVLADMEPQAVVAAGGRSDKTMENVGRRWWQARDELLVFAAGTPSDEASKAASDLTKDIATAWETFVALNRAFEDGGDVQDRSGAAQSAFDRATATAGRVREAVRAPAPA
jgi:hypothetical protein